MAGTVGPADEMAVGRWVAVAREEGVTGMAEGLEAVTVAATAVATVAEAREALAVAGHRAPSLR